jgi:hypothetical protein
MRYVKAFLNVLLGCVLMSVLWVAVAIVAHRPPTNCGRACLDPGRTENPAITLIGDLP